MIVECFYCEARVDAQVIASHVNPLDEVTGQCYKIFLLSCQICHHALVVGQVKRHYKRSDAPGWNSAIPIWPSPDMPFSCSWRIPEIVRSSLEKANKCFKVGAYSSCAVMCGRALEGICRHHKTKSEYLAGGLKELMERGIIDGRLYNWSEALRIARNASAHPMGASVSEEDTHDLVLFANAICEYVFVLSAQFDEYMKRQDERNKRPDI